MGASTVPLVGNDVDRPSTPSEKFPHVFQLLALASAIDARGAHEEAIIQCERTLFDVLTIGFRHGRDRVSPRWVPPPILRVVNHVLKKTKKVGKRLARCRDALQSEIDAFACPREMRDLARETLLGTFTARGYIGRVRAALRSTCGRRATVELDHELDVDRIDHALMVLREPAALHRDRMAAVDLLNIAPHEPTLYLALFRLQMRGVGLPLLVLDDGTHTNAAVPELAFTFPIMINVAARSVGSRITVTGAGDIAEDPWRDALERARTIAVDLWKSANASRPAAGREADATTVELDLRHASAVCSILPDKFFGDAAMKVDSAEPLLLCMISSHFAQRRIPTAPAISGIFTAPVRDAAGNLRDVKWTAPGQETKKFRFAGLLGDLYTQSIVPSDRFSSPAHFEAAGNSTQTLRTAPTIARVLEMVSADSHPNMVCVNAPDALAFLASHDAGIEDDDGASSQPSEVAPVRLNAGQQILAAGRCGVLESAHGPAELLAAVALADLERRRCAPEDEQLRCTIARINRGCADGEFWHIVLSAFGATQAEMDAVLACGNGDEAAQQIREVVERAMTCRNRNAPHLVVLLLPADREPSHRPLDRGPIIATLAAMQRPVRRPPWVRKLIGQAWLMVASDAPLPIRQSSVHGPLSQDAATVLRAASVFLHDVRREDLLQVLRRSGHERSTEKGIPELIAMGRLRCNGRTYFVPDRRRDLRFSADAHLGAARVLMPALMPSGERRTTLGASFSADRMAEGFSHLFAALDDAESRKTGQAKRIRMDIARAVELLGTPSWTAVRYGFASEVAAPGALRMARELIARAAKQQTPVDPIRLLMTAVIAERCGHVSDAVHFFRHAWLSAQRPMRNAVHRVRIAIAYVRFLEHCHIYSSHVHEEARRCMVNALQGTAGIAVRASCEIGPALLLDFAHGALDHQTALARYLLVEPLVRGRDDALEVHCAGLGSALLIGDEHAAALILRQLATHSTPFLLRQLRALIARHHRTAPGARMLAAYQALTDVRLRKSA